MKESLFLNILYPKYIKTCDSKFLTKIRYIHIYNQSVVIFILFSKSKTLILNMQCRLILNSNRGIIEWILDNFSMQETKVKKMNVVYKIL